MLKSCRELVGKSCSRPRERQWQVIFHKARNREGNSFFSSIFFLLQSPIHSFLCCLSCSHALCSSVCLLVFLIHCVHLCVSLCMFVSIRGDVFVCRSVNLFVCLCVDSLPGFSKENHEISSHEDFTSLAVNEKNGRRQKKKNED